MKTVERTPVKSSNIRAIGHDPESKTLEVEFSNGGVYHYHGVDSDQYNELLKAESVGRHLNTHIKGHHKFSKADQ